MSQRAKSEALGKSIAEKLISLEGTAKAWDLKLVDAGEGWANASMIIRDDMLNGHGTAHGGMIFALADTAFAWACNSRNVKTFAQHASISFLSPALAGEHLTAKAREQSTAGRTGVYTVKVMGEDERIVAIFQGLSRTAGGSIIEQSD